MQIPQVDVDRMVACPAPSYLMGFDVQAEDVGFILSMNESRGPVAGLATRHRIDRDSLVRLHEEVVTFWSGRDMTLKSSSFREEG